MENQNISKLFVRDLDKIILELNLFQNEELIWKTIPGVKNSAGNLSQHICGNLKHFLGTVLGQSGYIREREKEFSEINLPKQSLIQNLEETKIIVQNTLLNIQTSEWEKDYPLIVFEEKMSTEWFILHLLTHLNYHLGQINYLRRSIEV